jgi:hypothetical protein
VRANPIVWGGLIASLLCASPSQLHSQGPATVGAVIAGAQALKSTINDTLGNAGVEGRSVVDSANGTIDGAIAQLKKLTDNDLGKRVDELSGTAQAVATRLQNTIDGLNQVLKIRMSCGLDGLEQFVYGVRTLTSGLQNAIPLIERSAPYLYSFTFDGHHSGIVPREGGRLSIQGFSLWASDTAPKVTLVDEASRKPIMPLTAERAADNNTISVRLDTANITPLFGKCAEFEVIPRKEEGVWPFRHEVVSPAMYLPICIPKTLSTAVRVVVSSNFQCPTTDTPHPLDPVQEFRCNNDSCENTGECNVQHSWNIPAGCTITGTEKAPGPFMRDATVDTVAIKNVGGNYTAAGKINTASCSKFGGGLIPAVTKPIIQRFGRSTHGL